MHFSKLDDSPMFRKQLQALEETADSLKDRCLKFYKGCRKYTEGLGEAYDGDIGFASSLESFGGGFDDPIYTAVGGSVTTKFAIALREISTYKEILRSQVELNLNEQLIQFASIDLQDIKEVRKRFDKASLHYDQSREKFLSLKKGTKVDVVSEIEEELRNSRSAFEQARFNLVTCLSNIEAKKKFEFLESVSGAMDAHLRYFKQGYELLHQMEPYIHEVSTYAQQCREQATYEQAALAERMQDFRQQMERDNQRSFSDIEASPSGDGIHAVGRSSHKMIEAIMQSTSNGKVQTIKQGYLLKRSSSLRGDWKRRFFVLDSRGRLYYYHKHWGSSTGGAAQEKGHSRGPEHNGILSRFRSSHHVSPQADKVVLHHTVNLLTATIKLDAEQTDLRFCFRIISPSKNYSLQAESAIDRMDWIDKITGVIASLLNSQSSDQPSYSNRLLDSPVRSSYRCTGSDCSSLSSSCELDPTFWDGSRGPRPHFRNPRDRPTRGLFPPSGEQVERPIDVLRCVPGNEVCADCNSADPDWASLNMGILLCIECSGVHRNLGVHISKVRSLTLDVKVWEPSVISLFQSLGNNFCNSVWEELISDQDESRTLDDCSNVEFDSLILKRKPVPRDSFVVKERYIQSKYVEKLFTSKSDNEFDLSAAPCKIWNAVKTGNKKLVYRLLVCSGADANTTYDQAMEGNASAHMSNNISRTREIINSGFSSSSSAAIRDEKSFHSGEMAPSLKLDHSSSPDVEGSTLLHLACQSGDIAMVELLIQYGAHVNAVDSSGQTPLHRCALHARTACAKLLLSRGAASTIVDKLGKTALQAAMEDSNRDNELLALLS